MSCMKARKIPLHLSALTVISDAHVLKHRGSASKWNNDMSQAGSTITTETTQLGELFSGTSSVSKFPVDGVTMSDQMDLLVEQVKMLAGEIAFNTSTRKRLTEQSMNDPEAFKTQIQSLEHEIQEKRKQMRVLEQQIVESGEASVANASIVEMQQMVIKLTTQCSEQNFELEIKTADNRVLQEQLQNKVAENKELQDKILHLEQLASVSSDKPSGVHASDKHVEELRKEMQSMEMKEKEHKSTGNGVANSRACKVCFEFPPAALLLPCRHFSLCKSCSLACSECPLCRTKIQDRIFEFTMRDLLAIDNP